MIRSTILHEILAVSLLGACIVGGLTSTYSIEDRSTAVAEPLQSRLGGAPPAMVVSHMNIDESDPVTRRIFADYGAVFAARNGAVPPPTVIFSTLHEVEQWQARVPVLCEAFGAFNAELQAPAMTALLAARDEARAAGLDITARDVDASRRSYDDTVKLWLSRVEPALAHWVALKRLEPAEAERIRRLAPVEQVPEVLALEAKGIYFNTDFSRSILYSVAAPGTSQHLSMLAFDANEFDDAAVRAALARHGWFQTVVGDLPHFTYLGVDERALPSLGLKRVVSGGRPYWVPNLGRP